MNGFIRFCNGLLTTGGPGGNGGYAGGSLWGGASVGRFLGRFSGGGTGLRLGAGSRFLSGTLKNEGKLLGVGSGAGKTRSSSLSGNWLFIGILFSFTGFSVYTM